MTKSCRRELINAQPEQLAKELRNGWSTGAGTEEEEHASYALLSPSCYSLRMLWGASSEQAVPQGKTGCGGAALDIELGVDGGEMPVDGGRAEE